MKHNNFLNEPNETAIIILGDSSLNFWLNKTDIKNKMRIAEYGVKIYCVRGNHEERPENLNYPIVYDENVKGEVYLDLTSNSIRYFKDGGEYNINGYSVLTIGGAYSVDKYYRLNRAAQLGQSFSGWFASEQLTEEEKYDILENVKDKKYDFVFTHTCPISWEPTDLFLAGIDQSKVDKSTEEWLEQVKDSINWGVWCFGHYHADRIEREHVRQFYYDYEELKILWEELK